MPSVVGVLALSWPRITIFALVILFLFAVFAFLAATVEAMRAFSAARAGRVLGHLLLGLVCVAAGVVALAWPGLTGFVLVLVVATWAVVAGLLEFFAGFRHGEIAGTRAGTRTGMRPRARFRRARPCAGAIAA